MARALRKEQVFIFIWIGLLTPWQISSTVKSALTQVGVAKMDFIGFDACLMATQETTHQVRFPSSDPRLVILYPLHFLPSFLPFLPFLSPPSLPFQEPTIEAIYNFLIKYSVVYWRDGVLLCFGGVRAWLGLELQCLICRRSKRSLFLRVASSLRVLTFAFREH